MSMAVAHPHHQFKYSEKGGIRRMASWTGHMASFMVSSPNFLNINGHDGNLGGLDGQYGRILVSFNFLVAAQGSEPLKSALPVRCPK